MAQSTGTLLTWPAETQPDYSLCPPHQLLEDRIWVQYLAGTASGIKPGCVYLVPCPKLSKRLNPDESANRNAFNCSVTSWFCSQSCPQHFTFGFPRVRPGCL